MKQKQLVRLKFQEAVFKRDGHKCKFCNRTDNLDAHHITDRNELPNGGYVVENGITLCPEHHLMAELWHQTNGQEWHPGMRPLELYEKIGSNFDLAHEKSLKLK